MTDKATTMRISARNRDALLAVIAEHDDATTLDEALRIVLFEWEGYQGMARLAADPKALADYQAEALMLSEGSITVDEDPYDWGPDVEAKSPRRTR
jgi:hypothetical protein